MGFQTNTSGSIYLRMPSGILAGDFNLYLQHSEFLPLLISALLGCCIGLERELAGKDPSLRTFSLICLGSCAFAVVSLKITQNGGHGDPGRIAAQIVTGIGFLGAGVIFRSQEKISGLTTAALMWVTSSIGVAVGFGMIDEAVTTTFLGISIVFLMRIFHKVIDFIELKRKLAKENKNNHS